MHQGPFPKQLRAPFRSTTCVQHPPDYWPCRFSVKSIHQQGTSSKKTDVNAHSYFPLKRHSEQPLTHSKTLDGAQLSVGSTINSSEKFSRPCKMQTLTHREPCMTHMFPPRALQFKMRTKLLDLRGLPQQCNWLLEVTCFCLHTCTHTTYNTLPTNSVQRRVYQNYYSHSTEENGIAYNMKSWTWDFRFFLHSFSECSNFKLLLGHSF